jgi:hypothetical protein
LILFFLVQGISIPGLSAETLSLNPPTRVSLNESQLCIKNICDIYYLGLFIYKMDAKNRQSKDDIIDKYSGFISNFSSVKFDLEHMDIGKKGWTRYYPFSINGMNFIARVFLAREHQFQPKVKVLFEAATSDSELIFQVLPGVNDILADCSIKPYNLYPRHETELSP